MFKVGPCDSLCLRWALEFLVCNFYRLLLVEIIEEAFSLA